MIKRKTEAEEFCRLDDAKETDPGLDPRTGERASKGTSGTTDEIRTGPCIREELCGHADALSVITVLADAR